MKEGTKSLRDLTHYCWRSNIQPIRNIWRKNRRKQKWNYHKINPWKHCRTKCSIDCSEQRMQNTHKSHNCEKFQKLQEKKILRHPVITMKMYHWIHQYVHYQGHTFLRTLRASDWEWWDTKAGSLWRGSRLLQRVILAWGQFVDLFKNVLQSQSLLNLPSFFVFIGVRPVL